MTPNFILYFTLRNLQYWIVYLYFSIGGTLHSVDQYLNIKLTDISVTDPDKYPHMVFWLFLFCKHAHTNSVIAIAISQELFHKRVCGPVCSTATRRGWYSVTSGCSTQRITTLKTLTTPGIVHWHFNKIVCSLVFQSFINYWYYFNYLTFSFK